VRAVLPGGETWSAGTRTALHSAACSTFSEEEVAAALAAVEGAMPVPHGAPPRPMLP